MSAEDRLRPDLQQDLKEEMCRLMGAMAHEVFQDHPQVRLMYEALVRNLPDGACLKIRPVVLDGNNSFFAAEKPEAKEERHLAYNILYLMRFAPSWPKFVKVRDQLLELYPDLKPDFVFDRILRRRPAQASLVKIPTWNERLTLEDRRMLRKARISPD